MTRFTTSRRVYPYCAPIRATGAAPVRSPGIYWCVPGSYLPRPHNVGGEITRSRILQREEYMRVRGIGWGIVSTAVLFGCALLIVSKTL